jgi:hypothetical protein
MTDNRDRFDHQIAERLRAHENRVPVTAEPPRSLAASKQPWLYVAASIAVVAAVVVLALPTLLEPTASAPSPTPVSSGTAASESPATSPTPTASSTPSASPSPTPPSGPFAVGWSPVELPGSNVAVQSVLRVEGRLIAAGRDGVEAAAWISDDDGATWQRATIQSTRDDSEHTSFAKVVALDDALVGVGWWGAANTDQFAWLTWLSTDGGLTWTEHRDEMQPYAMRTATVHGDNIIGVGWNYGGLTPFDSWVALSDDGRTWRRIDPEAMQLSRVDAIATAGNRLIAVGSRSVEGGTGESAAFAWVSDDEGASWRPIPLASFGGAPTSFARDVVVRQDGSVVAVGASIDDPSKGIPTAWISTDGGETWRVENMGAGGAATAVAANDRGIIAVGGTAPYNPGPVASYTSDDGILWATTERVTNDERYVPTAIGDGLRVIVGLSCTSEDPCPGPLVIGTVHELER